MFGWGCRLKRNSPTSPSLAGSSSTRGAGLRVWGWGVQTEKERSYLTEFGQCTINKVTKSGEGGVDLAGRGSCAD